MINHSYNILRNGMFYTGCRVTDGSRNFSKWSQCSIIKIYIELYKCVNV